MFLLTVYEHSGIRCTVF